MRKGKHALLAAIVVVAVAALTVATTAPARTGAQTAAIKAAWIYVGPHNDGGWSQAHDSGRLYVQKKLGKNVITTYKENVPEGPQASQVIDSLVRDGNKIIFATSFGYMDAMAAAAKKYPDVYFEHATGYKTAKNLRRTTSARARTPSTSPAWPRARRRRRASIGYIVPFPIPEVIRHANAFALGAQAMQPGREGQARLDELVVRPGEGEEGGREPRRRRRRRASARTSTARPPASTRSRRGCRGSATTATRRSSRRRRGSPRRSTTGAPTTSSGSRRRRTARWKTGSYYGHDQGRLHGHRAVRPEGHRARRRRDRGEAGAADRNGTFYEFQGPLYDQSGKLRVPKGKRMTLGDPLRDELARQGHRGKPQGLVRSFGSRNADG